MKIRIGAVATGSCFLMLFSTTCQADETCAEAQSHSMMVSCANADFKLIDKSLSDKFEQVLSKIPGKRNDSVDWPKMRRHLINGQKQWTIFRQEDCASLFVANGIGQIRVLEELSCLKRHTERRIEDLDKWLQRFRENGA